MRIGVDIGGTKIEAVAIDAALGVLASYRGPVRRGADGVTDVALAAVREVATGVDEPVESIGIGVPGAVRRGVIHHARNLDIGSFDLETAVAEATCAVKKTPDFASSFQLRCFHRRKKAACPS